MKDQIEKQAIEEMAKDVARSISWCNEEIPCVDCLGTAASLYAKGYRKQEWISVEDRLPEENGRYLVCVNTSYLDFELRTVVAVLEITSYSKSHGFYLYNETEKVTHWMAFPEAPKMKGGAE